MINRLFKDCRSRPIFIGLCQKWLLFPKALITHAILFMKGCKFIHWRNSLLFIIVHLVAKVKLALWVSRIDWVLALNKLFDCVILLDLSYKISCSPQCIISSYFSALFVGKIRQQKGRQRLKANIVIEPGSVSVRRTIHQLTRDCST